MEHITKSKGLNFSEWQICILRYAKEQEEFGNKKTCDSDICLKNMREKMD